MFRFTFRLNRTVLGVIAVGIAIAVSSFSAVRAELVQRLNRVIYNCSSGTACVEGSSTGTSTWGVYGTATKSDGVHGVTSSTTGGSGVTGISKGTSGKGSGVIGKSSNGDGIYGTTSAANSSGVSGISTVTSTTTSYGVLGMTANPNPNGFGVYGYGGTYGTGVEGAVGGDGTGVEGFGGGEYSDGVYGLGGTGVVANGTFSGIYATASSGGQPITSMGTPSGGYFDTDYAGDGTFSGTVTAAGYKTAVRRRDGIRVTTSSSLAPRATIEDTATARLTDGVGIVHLATDFASTIDANKGYQVFLTPDGETRGWLYVAAKYQGGFIVREAEHGRSSIYFDYRVVAHPADSSDQRFPIYNPERPRNLKLPAHPQRPHLPSGG
jgi:hypothetical protein